MGRTGQGTWRGAVAAAAGAVTLGALLVGGTATGAPPGGQSGGSTSDLVFQRETVAGDHTQTDLYALAAGAEVATRLTRTPKFNEFGPDWSLAADQIAFWRTNAPFGTGSLWVMATDGTAQRRLTSDIDARDPSWNDDGTRLVYDQAANDLYTLRVSDGLDRQRLTSGPPFDFEPAWSPDGARIAFTRGSATGDPGDIYVLRLAGHVLTRVTHTAAYDHQVGWGPAGHRLVFERDLPDRSAIFTIRLDGTDLRRVTRGPVFDVTPAYTPDGQQIAFGSDRDSMLDNLWQVDADGTDPQRLLDLQSASSPAYPR